MKILFLLFVLSVVTVSAAGPTPVQPPDIAPLLRKPLTIDSAVRIALLNNRTLQATFEDIGLSQADLQEARQIANPSLDLTLKFPDRSPSGALTEWGLMQNFLDVLMIPLRTAVAKNELAAVEARVADVTTQTVAEVKISFIQIQADIAVGEKLTANLAARRVSLEFAQKLHAAGNITDLALLTEQAAYSSARLEIAKATADAREHREDLNRLLSLWGPQTNWKITVPLPDIPDNLPSVAHLESLAVANRRDLAAARFDLESAMRSSGLAKNFRFLGGLGFGLVGEHEPDGGNLNGASLSIELPIFNQGQARISRSQARFRKAARQFEGLAIDIRSDTRTLRDRLLAEADMARFFREDAVPTRQKIVALTLQKYNAMITGAFELFAARREAIEAERNLIEATRDYWLTHARLERTVGGDLAATVPALINRK